MLEKRSSALAVRPTFQHIFIQKIVRMSSRRLVRCAARVQWKILRGNIAEQSRRVLLPGVHFKQYLAAE